MPPPPVVPRTAQSGSRGTAKAGSGRGPVWRDPVDVSCLLAPSQAVDPEIVPRREREQVEVSANPLIPPVPPVPIPATLPIDLKLTGGWRSRTYSSSASRTSAVSSMARPGRSAPSPSRQSFAKSSSPRLLPRPPRPFGIRSSPSTGRARGSSRCSWLIRGTPSSRTACWRGVGLTRSKRPLRCSSIRGGTFS